MRRIGPAIRLGCTVAAAPAQSPGDPHRRSSRLSRRRAGAAGRGLRAGRPASPETAHDPAVESVEESAHVGLAKVQAHPRITVLISAISSRVVTGAVRRVRRRIWSLKCWMDLARGNAYRSPARTPLRIFSAGSRSDRWRRLIL